MARTQSVGKSLYLHFAIHKASLEELEKVPITACF